MDPDRYLERLEFAQRPSPTAESLAALQRAHLLSVPFDALDCHLGIPVTLDPADAYRKVVEVGRGGFCFELNGLFAWLLEQLGFEVSRLSARPLRGPDSIAEPDSHLALMVQLERRWLVDVGFGFPFAIEPLDVDLDSDQDRDGRRFRISRRDGSLLAQELDEIETRGYEFSLEPVPIDRFSEQCAAFSTDPDSGFVRNGPVLQIFEDGWLRVTRERLSGQRSGRELRCSFADRAEWRKALSRHFGLLVEGSTVSRTTS